MEAPVSLEIRAVAKTARRALPHWATCSGTPAATARANRAIIEKCAQPGEILGNVPCVLKKSLCRGFLHDFHKANHPLLDSKAVSLLMNRSLRTTLVSRS